MTAIMTVPFVFAQGQATQQVKADNILSCLSDTGKIIPDLETNSFIIIDYPANIAKVEEFLEMADVPSKQVLIEARIIEVRLEKEHSLGVNWRVFADKGGFEMGQFRVGSAASLGGISALEQAIDYKDTHYPPSDSTQIEDPFTIAIFDENINIVLKALAAQLKTDMLSAPKISTVNNRRAKIDIIKTTPYIKEIEKEDKDIGDGLTRTTITYVYDYTDEGVSLEVTPIINPDDSITLLLFPQIKTILKWKNLPAPGDTTLDLPETDIRVANTKVTVKDGQTLVIGGLIRERMADGVSKIPFLGDIPILGTFFSSKTKFKQKTELLIFVSPAIISPEESAWMAKQEKYGPGRVFAEGRKKDLQEILKLDDKEERLRRRAEELEMQKLYRTQKDKENLALNLKSLEERQRILQREREDLEKKIIKEEEALKSLKEDKEELLQKRRRLEETIR